MRLHIDEKPRVSTNDTVTIHRLIVNGGGIGVLSGFIADPIFRRAGSYGWFRSGRWPP
jgi:hypothetical protein